MEHVLELLRQEYREQIKSETFWQIEELRLCVGQPTMIRAGAYENRLWPKATGEDLDQLVRTACRQSIYAHTETLRQGFITIEGGHRIGICGFGVLQGNEVHGITSVSSAVIRIARQVMGCADRLVELKGSTLILGAPGSGKTTLLRDLIRQLSDKRFQRIGVADERGELSAAVHGVPQLQVGMRTDILVNIPKAQSTMMLLRTMHPQWIAMDEVTAPADLDAMENISYCGVNLLATAHVLTIEDLKRRPLYRKMMEMKIFQNLVLLHQDKTYEIMEVE